MLETMLVFMDLLISNFLYDEIADMDIVIYFAKHFYLF